MEIKRENGDQYRIEVRFWKEILSQRASYDVTVLLRAKGKRKWENVHSTDDYAWRRLNNAGRAAYELAKQLEHVTAEEIDAAKLACWEALKPEPTNTNQ